MIQLIQQPGCQVVLEIFVRLIFSQTIGIVIIYQIDYLFIFFSPESAYLTLPLRLQNSVFLSVSCLFLNYILPIILFIFAKI
jgi:hypothetical protein